MEKGSLLRLWLVPFAVVAWLAAPVPAAAQETEPFSREGYISPPEEIRSALLAPWYRNVQLDDIGPDGRYFVVRGRLWRTANPALPETERARQVRKLMRARRDVGVARRDGNADLMRRARRRVQEAKVALGERGPVWWDDGSPDYNRHLARNTPYAAWYAALAPAEAP